MGKANAEAALAKALAVEEAAASEVGTANAEAALETPMPMEEEEQDATASSREASAAGLLA